ncbi:MAG: MFS transporter [Pseudomonadota bacterium]
MTLRTRAAALTAAYYAVMFAVLGAHLPYWPIWLEHWGLTTGHIGWYLGAATIARIVGSTLIPAVADIWAVRRWIIVLTALATVAAHLAHLFFQTPAQLMVGTLIAAVVMAPPVPVGEALGLRAAERYGFAYAPIRAAGSVGFLIANISVGAAIGTFDPDLVLWIVVIGYSLVAVLGAVHPGGGAPARGVSDRAKPTEILSLLRLPAFVFFALAATTGQAGHVVYYVYSVLDWRAQGIPDATIGWLWAIGVIAETALLLGPGHRLIRKIGPAHALALGAAAGLIRWISLSMTPEPWMLWPLQALHAVSFAVAHLGAMAFLAMALPGRMISSAQGLSSGLLGGVLNASLLFLAGAVVASWDVASAYRTAAGMTVMSLVFSAVLMQVWRGGKLHVSESHGAKE